MSGSNQPSRAGTADGGGGKQSSNANYTAIPAAALRRFADDLENDSANNKFLEINRDRVQHFIEKPASGPRSSRKTATQARKTKIAGTYEYSFDIPGTNTSSFLHLQNKPEFQNSLGARSRFGEGDGSFFDRWLTSDVTSSKRLLDKDGLPLMKFSMGEVKTGFKHHIQEFKENKTVDPRLYYVKSYTERRAERLEKEKNEKSKSDLRADNGDTNEDHGFEPKQQMLSISIDAMGLENEEKKTKKADLKLPPITTPISAVERENYFGTEARTTFFDYFHSLSRQRLNYAVESAPNSPRDANLSPRKDNQDSPRKSPRESFAHKKSPRNISASDKSTKRLEVADRPTYSALRPRSSSGSNEEKQQLLEHLFAYSKHSRPGSMEEVKGRQRPSSARTVFLQGCVEKGVIPHPSIIIRKELTTMLNIASYGIGDQVAVILADALDLLPALEGLCIADNKLTDVGLEPIVGKLAFCKYLRSIDVSKNKVDSKTAEALRHFLSSKSCQLTELVMQNANVDDYEASRFMDSIAINNTLLDFDLSHNLLGSHEFVLRKAETAGESIGRLLKNPSCSLRSLKLSWNMIRFQSSIKLVESIQLNHSLTHLDLSYNKLGAEGGEVLGNVLHENNTLQVLKIAHNNINSRTATIILSGVKSCESLQEVDLSDNPIGEEGAKMLLSLNITHGHRVKVDIKNCSLKLKDHSCWFEAHNPRGDYELDLSDVYERMVAIELLRIVARDKDLAFTMLKYIPVEDSSGNGSDLLLELHTESMGTAGKPIPNIDQFAPKQVGGGMEPVSELRQDETVENEEGDEHEEGDREDVELELETKAPFSEAVEEGENQPAEEVVNDEVKKAEDDEEEEEEEEDEDRQGDSFGEKPKAITGNQQEGFDEISCGVHVIRELFREAANRIFQQYDQDNSGALDRDELAYILDQLGLEGSLTLVDKLMHIYDTDGSGFVEEEEFVSFLLDVKKSYEKENNLMLARRYFFNPSDNAKNKTNPKPYLPPMQGKIVLKVEGQKAMADFARTISTDQVESLLNTSKTLSDSSALFDIALGASTWTITEAKTIMKVMAKESGSVLPVLLKLLPRMATTLDAQMLIAFITSYEFPQIQHLRQLLGPLFRIFIGVPNGFYQLYLSDANDRAALLRLHNLSMALVDSRKKSHLGDCSQLGDWSCFRNVVLDGKAIPITEDFIEELPETGRLEFDFVAMESNSTKETGISNLRLFRLLVALGIVENSKRRRVFLKLDQIAEEGRQSSKGLGTKKWDIPHNSSSIISETLDTYFESYAMKRKIRPYMVTSTREESSVLEDRKRKTSSRKSIFQQRRGSSTLSAKSITSMLNSSSNPETPTGNSTNTALLFSIPESDGKGGASSSTVGNEVRTMDIYGNHIRDMMETPNSDMSFIAMRILDAFEMILCGRFLTCAQLALLVDKFPGGQLPLNDFSTFRVELIVTLFSRITDLVNFEFVLKELNNVEIAMLFFRLGWLNVWNPVKAEGNICLNLGRREERQIAKMLITLNIIEMGNNWIKPSFYESRDEHNQHNVKGNVKQAGEKDENEWTMPPSWLNEVSLPRKGILSMNYFSGKGVQLHGCEANPTVRLAMMPLVLARPFEEDIRHPSEFTTEHIKPILDKAGVHFTY